MTYLQTYKNKKLNELIKWTRKVTTNKRLKLNYIAEVVNISIGINHNIKENSDGNIIQWQFKN